LVAGTFLSAVWIVKQLLEPLARTTEGQA
jgi:hypothetical protein